MIKLILFATLAILVVGQELAQKGSLDDLLGDVFTKEPNNNQAKPVTSVPVVTQPISTQPVENDAPTVSNLWFFIK